MRAKESTKRRSCSTWTTKCTSNMYLDGFQPLLISLRKKRSFGKRKTISKSLKKKESILQLYQKIKTNLCKMKRKKMTMVIITGKMRMKAGSRASKSSNLLIRTHIQSFKNWETWLKARWESLSSATRRQLLSWLRIICQKETIKKSWSWGPSRNTPRSDWTTLQTMLRRIKDISTKNCAWVTQDQSSVKSTTHTF